MLKKIMSMYIAKYRLVCDKCKHEVTIEENTKSKEFKTAATHIRELGWSMEVSKGDWYCICPKCLKKGSHDKGRKRERTNVDRCNINNNDNN